MEDSRQDLRMKFRAATESSGLAGFVAASVGMLCVLPGIKRTRRCGRTRKAGRGTTSLHASFHESDAGRAAPAVAVNAARTAWLAADSGAASHVEREAAQTVS